MRREADALEELPRSSSRLSGGTAERITGDVPDASSPDLALALELADLADSISLPRFRAADLQVESKADGTPVTDVDRAVELALRETILRERPSEEILGEEEGGDPGPLAWIIDPIDGTKSFSRGFPIWATLIAFEREGEIACGVVSAPALGHRWWASRGRGAFRGSTPIRVSSTPRLADASVSAAYARDFAALEPTAWHVRAVGDFWQHVLVAEGALDAAIDSEHARWDYSALVPIVEEAGGRLSDLDGNPPRPGQQLVTSNGLVHDELLDLLQTGGR